MAVLRIPILWEIRVSDAMADYYLYLLDHNGRIVRRVDLQGCVDDDHARDVAAAHAHPTGMELWQGDRLVETFKGPKAQ